MQTVNPIMYPLLSAEEVVFVEGKLKEFRAKGVEMAAATTGEVQGPITPSEAVWKHMTKDQKLSLIDANWNLEALRDFKPWVIDNETVLAAMDLCAAAPGTWVTFKTACAAAKMGYYQGRGQMQALTKKKNQMGRGTWPMLADANPPGKIGLAYQMSPTVASLWTKVRSEP